MLVLRAAIPSLARPESINAASCSRCSHAIWHLLKFNRWPREIVLVGGNTCCNYIGPSILVATRLSASAVINFDYYSWIALTNPVPCAVRISRSPPDRASAVPNFKGIARRLGFEWSESKASGRQALIWRAQWETTRDPTLKRRLIVYNQEDCKAVQRVAEAIANICSEFCVPRFSGLRDRVL
jgi:hypothetical protein